MPKGHTGQRGRRSFRHAGLFASAPVRAASEGRGFAETRLLTHWAEIAGQEIAKISRPVEVKFGRDGLGATLVLLVEGAHAPLVEMQAEALREKVNAVYGYRAISRIRITQTAPTGFAEGQAEFIRAPKQKRGPTDAARQDAARQAAQIEDPALRQALESLGASILSRPKR
ncbi:MAG: DciA family protein [Pseudomonadota bacterium]